MFNVFDFIFSAVFSILEWFMSNLIGFIGIIAIIALVVVKIVSNARSNRKARREGEAGNDNEDDALEPRKKSVKKQKTVEVVDRQNYHCTFDGNISQDEFELMARRAARHIRRLSITVNGPYIEGTVESQSGISTWTFNIDFNDYGYITGNWWITYRGNYDSNIPNRFANLMSEAISQKI